MLFVLESTRVRADHPLCARHHRLPGVPSEPDSQLVASQSLAPVSGVQAHSPVRNAEQSDEETNFPRDVFIKKTKAVLSQNSPQCWPAWRTWPAQCPAFLPATPGGSARSLVPVHESIPIQLKSGRVSSLQIMREEVQYYFRTCLRIIANEGRENNPALISNTNKPACSTCLCPRKGVWHQGLALWTDG